MTEEQIAELLSNMTFTMYCAAIAAGCAVGDIIARFTGKR